jgi:hypothetical protein
MMRNPNAIFLLAPALFLACGTVPDGFTSEAWDRYQRENPNGAQVVRWIHESGPRRELLQTYTRVCQEHGVQPSDARVMFYIPAEQAMLTGGDLKGFIRVSYEQLVKDEEESLQRATTGLFPDPAKAEITNRRLLRDRAILAAIQK